MNDVPVLEKDYDVYPSYISGGTYALPEYYAYSYKNGKLERVLCDVVVKDAKGSKTYKAGSNATIDVNNNNDKVSFDVVCNGVTLAKHEAIGVLAWTNDNGKRLSIENYLVGNGFGINKTDEGLVLTATDSNSFSFVFANAISAGYGLRSLSLICDDERKPCVWRNLFEILSRRKYLSLHLKTAAG